MELQHLQLTKIARGAVTLHCLAGPEDGEGVNSQIVETSGHLVVVDCQLMRPYAKELRAYVDSLGKPVERVIVTHAHPDHWFGIEFFQDLPTWALAESIEEIRFLAPMEIQFHKGQHGDQILDAPVLPAHVLPEGEFVVDGVTFRCRKVTEAEDLFLLMVDLPAQKVLLAQDLVYNGVHMFVGQRTQDGRLCFDGWIAALRRAQGEGYEVVLPGHGAPTDATVFPGCIDYLEKMREIVATSTAENFVPRALEAFPGRGLPLMVHITDFFLHKMQG